jgi:hypothetical protein
VEQWIKSVLAWLECVMVKNVSFSTPGMCHFQKRQFQHYTEMYGGKMLVSAQLECVAVKKVSASMSGMCPCQKCEL